jgi:hypothetical protein
MKQVLLQIRGNVDKYDKSQQTSWDEKSLICHKVDLINKKSEWSTHWRLTNTETFRNMIFLAQLVPVATRPKK